jgi:hypothetical protein
MAEGKGKARSARGRARPGVWNRGLGKGPANPIRVRTKRLDEIDSDKIALAYWLLAKQIVDNQSDQRPLSESEVRRVARKLEDGLPPDAGGEDRKDATPKDEGASS